MDRQRAHRAQSSNLLIVNGVYYIVDAGDGVTRRLAKAGIPLRDIGTIFITHHHDDHTAGLGALMCASWNQNRIEPINVFGPQGTAHLIAAVVQYFSLNAELRMTDGGRSVPMERIFAGHDVGTGVIYRDENLQVTAVENAHFDFHPEDAAPRRRTTSYAYRFDTADRTVVFTGDTGPSDAVIALARGADLLISEVNSVHDRVQAMVEDGRWQAMNEPERRARVRQATQGHLSPEAVANIATSAGVKTVVLTHLTYRPPPKTDQYAVWADVVRRHFAGQVFVAEDLMEF